MDMYMIGKLALPVVVGIMGIAALLTMAMGIFTTLKTLENVQRFFQHLEESRRSSLTINITAEKRPSKPPMQDRE